MITLVLHSALRHFLQMHSHAMKQTLKRKCYLVPLSGVCFPLAICIALQMIRNICDKLREELQHAPEEFHDVPFHETIRKDAERMLWHQRLGHPSDHCLCNAHKHMQGVPQFKHQDGALDKCPACIQAKQTPMLR